MRRHEPTRGAALPRFLWRTAPRLALTALLAGCAAVHRPPATVASLERDAVAAAASEEALVDSIVDRLAQRAQSRGDRTIDILLLSGGGQNGAYGAGFLRGWKSRPDAPMPAFDLVTGVSTGALQAPFAFLGSQAALDTMSALYLRSAERFAPTLDWLFWLRRTGGLVNTSRFRRTLETVLDSSMQAALLSEFRDGRQLVISTTDLDLATGRSWDLSRELARPDDGLTRVRQLLLTSSSIPGIFPPQVIDGRVHADGGVIANVHPGLSLPQYERLAARLRARGIAEPVTVRLWVIMNLWVHAPAQVMNPASRKALNARTTLVLFWAQQSQLVQRLTELAQAVNGGVDGLRMEMRYTDIPASVANDPAASKLFSREFMEQLERMGFERGRSAAPWTTTLPSPYQRPR
jgi:hypothetical protein